MLVTRSCTDKWTNQRIAKKFRNRSCGSRAKRASNREWKQEVPDTMVRGWIRKKAPRSGKTDKYHHRSHATLRGLQYQSVASFESMMYGTGEDDYDEQWLYTVNDPWLRQQRKSRQLHLRRVQKKCTLRNKPSGGKSSSSSFPSSFSPSSHPPTPPHSAPAPPPPVAPAPAPPAAVPAVPPQPVPRPVQPTKTHFDDIEHAKSEQEQKEYALLDEQYSAAMAEIEGYGVYSSIENLSERSSFASHRADAADPTQENFKKIMKEIRKQLPQNVCTSVNGAMFVRFDESNPRFLQALLTGLDDTPYESGLFLFDIHLGANYPTQPLSIKHVSKGATLCHANNGPGGFSPNLHQSSGKVCLSLLGTWSGPGWESGKSNTYQVLSTIMWCILGADHPYYMEPSYGGWEGTVVGRKRHEKRVIDYDEEVMYHNVRYSMLETLRTPYVGYEDVVRLHFRLKRDWIVKTVQRWIDHENYSEGFKQKIKPVFKELQEELLKL